MSRRTLINLILLLCTCLLGALVWWSQPQPPPPLTRLQPEKITSITIETINNKHINLLKTDGYWRVDGKLANQERVGQLLGIAQTPSLKRLQTDSGKLDKFGLDRAQTTLTLNREKLLFGDLNSLNGWRYVLYKSQIHLVADGFQHHLTAASSAFLAEP